MIGLRRALLAIGVAGIAFAITATVLIGASDHDDDKTLTLVLGPIIGLSFLGTGLFAWWRRPENRIGALMCAVGFAWFLGALVESNNDWVFTIGVLVSSLFLGTIVHMLVAFPTGTVEGRGPRALVVAAYIAVIAIPLSIMLFRADLDTSVSEPLNKILVADDPDVADAFDAVGNVVALVLTLGLVAVLVQRWRRWSPVSRRSLTPVLGAGAALGAGLAVVAVVDILGGSNDLVGAFYIFPLACLVGVPFAFLVGLGRSQLSRAGAVSDLVARLNQPGPGLRDALAGALGDPSLRVIYHRAAREEWVDADGHQVELPEGATLVERDGVTIAALVHDPALDEEPELVRAAANAAALALDNERLAVELRARVAELEESRERLVRAGLTERRRLERDLHDGAQQRLVALSLHLGLARAKLENDPVTAAHLVDSAREELSQALAELRELARGIHPAILTDRGLDAALGALADRAPVPVALDALPGERLPAPVEAAAYFVVAESLTNVARYAQASEAHVRVTRNNGHAVVEVSDDGVGGAHATTGTGLRGLSDRLAALDGRLEIHSPPGEGTLVRATIPCAS